MVLLTVSDQTATQSSCVMKRHSPSSREALLCRLLKKVERNDGVVIQRASHQQESSTTPPLPEVAWKHTAVVPDGEKCVILPVSEFSVLVDSLSNVLQQFRGAHSSGADNIINTQGARGSGAKNWYW